MSAEGPRALPNRLDAVHEARIEEIAEMVRRSECRKGKTSKMLAQRWGLALSTAEHMVAEAWRRVRWEGEHGDQTVAEDVGACETVLFDSLEESRSPVRIEAGTKVYAESPSVPRKLVLEAVKTRIALRAAAGPLALVGSPQWRTLPVAQRAELVGRAQALLDAAKAQVDAEVAALAAAKGEGT